MVPLRPGPASLNAILDDIQKALDAKLYYLAIVVTLSLPHICAALESDPSNPNAGGKDYTRWASENLEPLFTHLTADDIYRMRNHIVHQGRFGRPRDQFSRILFTVPESQIQVHDAFLNAPTAAPGSDPTILENILIAFGPPGLSPPVTPGEKALCLQAVMFCQQVMGVVRKWLEKNKDNSNVRTNLPNLISPRAFGFRPYFENILVIA